jgi:hypothetical protein
MMLRSPALGLILFGVLATGCDDKPVPSKVGEPAPVATPVKSAAPKPPPDPLAGLVVDELGLYLRDRRVDLAAKDADAQLKAAIAVLPVKEKVVPITALRTAKTQHVGALARALGEAGASEIDVKTLARTGLEAQLKFVPQEVAGAQVPDCAVVAMIKKDNTSAVWRVKGGTATKFSKGLGGPDMSMTYDGMKDQMGSCASNHWLLAGEENVLWGLVFDLGQIVAKADPPPKAQNAVLVYASPVAGRAVPLTRKAALSP